MLGEEVARSTEALRRGLQDIINLRTKRNLASWARKASQLIVVNLCYPLSELDPLPLAGVALAPLLASVCWRSNVVSREQAAAQILLYLSRA
jgi:hypothetical protein